MIRAGKRRVFIIINPIDRLSRQDTKFFIIGISNFHNLSKDFCLTDNKDNIVTSKSGNTQKATALHPSPLDKVLSIESHSN